MTTLLFVIPFLFVIPQRSLFVIPQRSLFVIPQRSLFVIPQRSLFVIPQRSGGICFPSNHPKPVILSEVNRPRDSRSRRACPELAEGPPSPPAPPHPLEPLPLQKPSADSSPASAPQAPSWFVIPQRSGGSCFCSFCLCSSNH